MKKVLALILIAIVACAFYIYITSDEEDAATLVEANNVIEEKVSTKISADSIYRGFLITINKVNALPSDFEPHDLVNIYSTVEKGVTSLNHIDIYVNKAALAAFTVMVKAAKKEGLPSMNISSGYRSYEYQKKLFDNKVNSIMKSSNVSREQAVINAGKSVAYPGTSEHQTGLVMDIGTSVSTTYSTSNDKKWYAWLADNCWDYGYIIRYHKEKEKVTGYVYEPWHLRYVGLPHSQIMKEKDFCLEEYVDFLEAEEKLSWNGYEIEYYVIENESIPVEVSGDVVISGDGNKGIILTKKM